MIQVFWEQAEDGVVSDGNGIGIDPNMKKRQKVMMSFVGIQTGLDPWDVMIYEINLDPRERKRETERYRERERERERQPEGESASAVVACLCVR